MKTQKTPPEIFLFTMQILQGNNLKIMTARIESLIYIRSTSSLHEETVESMQLRNNKTCALYNL